MKVILNFKSNTHSGTHLEFDEQLSMFWMDINSVITHAVVHSYM